MKNISKQIKNPKVLQPLLLVLVALLTIGGFLFYESYRDRVFIDNSLVDAPVSTVSPSISGTLTQVDVYEGEQIKKGDSLAVVGGTTLYTDTDGVVVAVDNALGSNVTPQTAIVQLVNPNSMRIAGTLDENKGLTSIHVGQVVSFTVDALPGQTFWGYVDEVSPTAKSTQTAFSISSERPTQQFVVYAKFDSTKYPAIKNGMSAKMEVYTKAN